MRCVIVCIFMIFLAACATAPSRQGTPQPAGAELRVCGGMNISNAPRTDSAGYLIGYHPYTRIDGVTLARAPARACVSSGFGPRNGGAGSFHEGVDLFTRSPSEVYAGGDGVVESVSTLRGYGKTILVRHSRRLKTRYAHLSSYARGLSAGDRVRSGDIIGLTGRTGNATAVHLHYEVLLDGRPYNPLTVGN